MSLLAAQASADEQSRLDTCAAEPIRTPGTIQSHGALLVIDAATLEIRHASANTFILLGVAPAKLLGRSLQSLIGAVSLEQFANVLDHDVAAANPTLVVINGQPFDAILHRPGAAILIDLEPVLPEVPSWSAAVLYTFIHDLSQIRTADKLWAETARVVRKITRFDRVMIYHFHNDGHGQIVSEDLADGMERYFGLHYPASDIPAQARDLYLRKLSRVIADTADVPSPLLAVADGIAVGTNATGAVDLSVSELRSVSPHHLEFMRNMGQASTMSFSLVHDGRLIGMITCANQTLRRVPFAVRQGLEILANQVALQLSSIASINTLSRRMEVRSIRAALVAQLGDGVDISSALLRGPLTITDLIPADGIAIRLNGITTSQGNSPQTEEIAAVMDALQSRENSLPFVTEALALEHPDLARLAPTAVGMLAIPIGGDGDYVAWFRDELVHSIPWLGDQGTENRLTPLSPRNSFTSWNQTITGTAAAWDGIETEAAGLGFDLGNALLRRAESRLAHVAMHDPLTGLPNRRLLMDRLEHALAKYMRGKDLAVLFIDLDKFKAVNDTHGHGHGDAVLTTTAQRLLAAARAEDTVSRIGGDEFAILCEDTTLEGAEILAERILTALRAGTTHNAQEPKITASIGITSAGLSYDASDLLRQADAAMYRAKVLGGNRHSR